MKESQGDGREREPRRRASGVGGAKATQTAAVARRSASFSAAFRARLPGSRGRVLPLPRGLPSALGALVNSLVCDSSLPERPALRCPVDLAPPRSASTTVERRARRRRRGGGGGIEADADAVTAFEAGTRGAGDGEGGGGAGRGSGRGATGASCLTHAATSFIRPGITSSGSESFICKGPLASRTRASLASHACLLLTHAAVGVVSGPHDPAAGRPWA